MYLQSMKTGYTFMQSFFKEIGTVYFFKMSSSLINPVGCGGSMVAHQTSGFLSGISHIDPGALQDHCVIM